MANEKLGLHEALDFIGTHLFSDEWTKGDWKAYFWKPDIAILYNLGLNEKDFEALDRKPWTHDQRAQNDRARQVVSIFIGWAKNGALKPYNANGALKD